MFILFGQMETEKNFLELKNVIQAIEKDGMGTGLAGCMVSQTKLEPLSWCIRVQIPDDPNWSVNDTYTDKISEMVKRMAVCCGLGRYYFRGNNKDSNKILEFWEYRPDGISTQSNVFCGLPLSINVSHAGNIFEIYMDWLNKYIRLNFSRPFEPLPNKLIVMDPLRPLFSGVESLLSLKGNWSFQFVYSENQFLPSLS